MRPLDTLEEAYVALSANKIRSGLTVLGIVIGIASVITLVAVGQGTKQSVEASIESIGSNLVTVVPGIQRGGSVSQGRGSAQSLTETDAAAIQEISTAAAVAPDVSGRYQITTRGGNTSTSVVGTVPAYAQVRNIAVAEGSFLSDEQTRSAARVAVIGPNVRDDLFGAPDEGGQDPLGQTIRIKNIAFTVIGVTQAKGGFGFNSPDDTVYVPMATAQRSLAGTANLSTISVQAAGQQTMTQLQTDITNLLLQRHNIADASQADFFVINQADIAQTATSVTDTLTLLLAAIAGISLVVGGIGIMNMMLTTVTERTREIGLRKAIGAKKSDISLQFLTEAVLLTFMSGVIGVALGWLLSYAIESFVGLAASVTLTSVVLAFGVSAMIGIVFGLYPARRAAGLSPMEALRYE
ncbi:MAG: ABC transporter permease [Thermoleophilia bacterium]|nr:ABC transporter permease [Thermoleophilia bacterium]